MRTIILTFIVLAVVAPMSARADGEVAFARRFIKRQIEVVASGDVNQVKSTVEPRHYARITTEALTRWTKALANADVAALAATAARDKRGNIVITRKDGRRLTTLIEADGLWRADSLWFSL